MDTSIPHVAWGGAERGEVFAMPRSLQTWAGERVDVAVDTGEVALVRDDGEVVAAMLPGRHPVHVLRRGEDPGDIDRREFAARMRVDVDAADRLKRRTRFVATTADLVFVATESLVPLEFGTDAPVLFHDRRHGAVPLEMTGAARLAVYDPVRFHDSFLRCTEDLRAQDFDQVVTTLVEAGLGQALEQDTDDVERIGSDRGRLAVLGTDFLQHSLSAVGLGIEQLELTRVETPTRGASATPASALATPGARR